MLITTLGFVFSQEESPLEFSQTKQKFGKVPEGQDVYLTFAFINKGEKPVIINEARVNCTCTVVTYPKEPISPNTKGVINIGFHTKGKIGYQERTVELITDQGTSEIMFKGAVKATEHTKEEHKHSH
jgi:hypothetical protein